MSDLTEVIQARVALVLVNWNGWRDCIECIDSVLVQAHRNFHVFIVDNDSRDGSIDQIVAWCAAPEADPNWHRQLGVARYTDQPVRSSVPCRVVDRSEKGVLPADNGCRVTLIRSGGNLGFAGGCNVGIRAAGLDDFAYFWFLNPDTVVDRWALVELIGRAEKQPGIGIVGSTLRFYDEPELVQAMGGARLNRSNRTSRHL